jgi:hypothetical protein
MEKGISGKVLDGPPALQLFLTRLSQYYWLGLVIARLQMFGTGGSRRVVCPLQCSEDGGALPPPRSHFWCDFCCWRCVNFCHARSRPRTRFFTGTLPKLPDYHWILGTPIRGLFWCVYPTGESILDAFARTIIAGGYNERLDEHSKASIRISVWRCKIRKMFRNFLSSRPTLRVGRERFYADTNVRSFARNRNRRAIPVLHPVGWRLEMWLEYLRWKNSTGYEASRPAMETYWGYPDRHVHGVMHGEVFKPSKCQPMSFT